MEVSSFDGERIATATGFKDIASAANWSINIASYFDNQRKPILGVNF
jgi:hypothetical protein